MSGRRLQRERLRQHSRHATAIRERYGDTADRLILLERLDPGFDHAASLGYSPDEVRRLVTALANDPDALLYEPDAIQRLHERYTG